MPAVVTVHLQAPSPLFLDETWPLEERFLHILGRGQPAPSEIQRRTDAPKPYALSPLWRTNDRQLSPSELLESTGYHWRVSLLDDALTSPFLQGLEETETIDLDGIPLAVAEVAVKEQTYQEIARRSQASAQARPKKVRRLGLEFLTPVLLYRAGLPMPFPDPVLVFRHYLTVWDTYAPRDLWVNFNLLDAVKFHVAPIEHRLETRHVRLADERAQVGVIGSIIYTVRRWQKLGDEFLGTLLALTRLGVFCGTGLGTERGLGQTRRLKGRPK